MTAAMWEELRSRFGERLLIDEPLSRHSTFRIGGLAAAMLLPNSAEDVAGALKYCAESGLQWVALGLGSNVLISDDGFAGLVVRVGKGMGGVIDRDEDNRIWKVGAGMPTPRLARQTSTAGFSGVHKLVGIPGTVGGGIATNAGANGQEYSQVVRTVECVLPDGTLSELHEQQITWQYRRGLEGVIITAATLEFDAGNSDEQEAEIRRLHAIRKERTPFEAKCCGSVFKNPPVVESRSSDNGREEMAATAGQLIDAAGLKGFRIGNAEVSKKHANYIVNLGGATAAEVMAVIDSVRGRVFGAFGVELELEVRIL